MVGYRCGHSLSSVFSLQEGGDVPRQFSGLIDQLIPGLHYGTRRAKLLVVARATLSFVTLRAPRLTPGLAWMANAGLWGASVAVDTGLEANSSGGIQIDGSAYPPHLGFACELGIGPL